MDRKWKSGASIGAPAAADNASDGYPTAGNPGGGVAATKPGPYWYYMVTEEILAVIAAAGIAFDKTVTTQLRDAILKLGISALPVEVNVAVDDEMPILDVTEGGNNKVTVANLLKVIGLLTADAVPDLAADAMLTYDASAGAAKKVVLANLIAAAIASQAEQEAAALLTRLVTPARQHFHPSAVKGWVKTNLAGNIDGSYNVNSIIDVGTGVMTVNWETDFSSVGYCAVASTQRDSAIMSAIANTAIAAGATQVRSWDTAGLAVDGEQMYCAVMGDQ